ncbi:hypothetical protein AB3466_06620 [Sphingobacterium thalpophilum]|uniref:hypothetical protein n=1 Tax=Sphingobacterium thalpophilum TaxID=259 RepID=UPI002D7A0240|nr:hypothetical protein [Sphingobacterium thalpophilum]
MADYEWKIKEKMSMDMKKLVMIAAILMCTVDIVYSQDAYNNWSKLQSNFVRHIRYPIDLEKASIPSFFTLKVQYNKKAKQYDLEFSDSAHPLMINEILRIKDKLDFDVVYKDLNIENHDIPIMIPIEIKIARVSHVFSDPKSKVSQDLYNFKGQQAIGDFWFYSPLVLMVINN